ncbi:MAG: hypothetical protein JXB36_09235 [Gammaproteobacteria bacterium]|nr:hypothetical protein [Gammaproteobacteria bacterium]
MAVESVDVAGAPSRPESIAPSSSLELSLEPTVTAFLGRTERGPVNEPIELRNFDDYRRVFGGHCAFSHLPHTVQHYFQNGGERAVVVRLTNGATHAVVDVPAGNERLRLKARRPGSRETLRVSVDYDRVEHDAERFNLVVQRLSRSGSAVIEDQELFPAVSVSGRDARFVVDVLKSSELVSVVGPLPSRRPNATSAVHPGQAIPYLGMTAAGSDGRELTDYDVIGSKEEGTGLFALDRVERIDLLCIPPAPERDVGTTAFVAASGYCARRRAMLIWDPPWSWEGSGDALRGIRATGIASGNALTYFPRIRPRAEYARFPAGIPACGALAGMLAAADAALLAGDRGASPLLLRASLTTAADVGERQISMLHRFGVNALVRMQGGHVELRGNACFAVQDTRASPAQRLDTRRTALFVLGSLERGTRWVCREIGADDACERLEALVKSFMAQLHELGVLKGKRPEQAWLVRVARRPAGAEPEIMLRVGFSLLRPEQLAIYELRFRASGMETRAVPPLDTQ